MRNMHATHVAYGDGSMILRGKGLQSAMTASPGFEKSCDYCNKHGHKKAQCFKFLHESDTGPLPSSDAEISGWGSSHNTHLRDNADCHAQHQQRGNGGGSGYTRGNNNSSNGNGNRRRHDGGSNTGRANTTVTANGTSSPTAITPVPVARLLPRLLRFLLHLVQLLLRLLRLLPRLLLHHTAPSSRLHRTSVTRSL